MDLEVKVTGCKIGGASGNRFVNGGFPEMRRAPFRSFRTVMSGDHAWSCQSIATGRSRPVRDVRARRIRLQGQGLLTCTCLVQLQMRLVFPAITS